MYSLTIENLAFCRLLEELYDIFCIMCAAIAEESESERANYESLKIAVKKAVKTKLETFLFKNRYLFPPDGKSIHFNVAQFDQFFAKAVVSKNVGTTYIINPSFTIFCTQLRILSISELQQ